MGKHLTLDQRITIQVELERNTPIKAIARMIGKAPRTVSYRAHRPSPGQLAQLGHLSRRTHRPLVRPYLASSRRCSISRKSLGDRRPVDLFDEAFGPDARLALGIRKIAPRDIVLTPALLNR